MRKLRNKCVRYKIKEDLTTIRHSIVEQEGEWHKKWKEFLGLSPFSLIKGWTPAVDLLPPMSPLSFDPASEEVYAKSILLQYPASLPDTPKQYKQENDCRRASDVLGTKCDLAKSPTSFLLQAISSSDRNSVTLLEKDMKVRTPREKNEIISKKITEFETEESSSLNIAKNTDGSAFGGSLPAEKSDPFQKEQDHLVEEVARAVLSDSPQPSKGEVKLEELIDSLVSNPFLTRNQIPRTPENLISEIRSSWRKAVEVEDTKSTEPIQMDTEHREVLPESFPEVHNQGEFSMASYFSATTMSNSSHSHSPEEKVISDRLKCLPQKPVVSSHRGEPTTQNMSDLLNKEIICKQDLECTALQNKLLETSQIGTFSPIVGNRRDVIDDSEKECIKISDHSKASYKDLSMHKSMLWNSFQISSGISSNFKVSDFGILHETLPEDDGHLSLNSSSSTEASFKLEPNSPMHSGIFPEDVVGERQTTPELDFNLQAICSGYEALKKTLSKQREEIYLSNSETLERHEQELSLSPQNMQADDMLNFLGTHDLHTDYTKPSLRMSFGERKQSLSPLIKFSPVEQRLRTTIPCSLGELLPNLTEEEVLNKSLNARESPFDLKK